MQITKNSGRILGLLFLASAIAGGAGTAMRGLTAAGPQTNAFLKNVFENTGQMKLAISLDILSSAIAVGMAVFLFPFIKKYSQRLAVSYFGIALINFAIIAVSNIIHVALLSVSADFATVNVTSTEAFTTVANMLYNAYYWTHFLMLMLYSVGGSVLFFFLFKTALVPRWLALWGLLASAIVFLGGALQLADIEVSFLLFVQNGIFILTFIGWLLAMGFRPAKLDKVEAY